MDHPEATDRRSGVPPVQSAAVGGQDDGLVHERELQATEAANPSVRTASEHLDRLIADQELLTTLQLHGYEGEAWNEFEMTLFDYGLGIITAWVQTRQIFRKCAEKRFAPPDFQPPPTAWMPRSVVRDLAEETVVVAVHKYRTTVLIPGKWDPRKGASLKTFFIGQCLMRFYSIYRTWFRAELRYRKLGPSELGTDEDLANSFGYQDHRRSERTPEDIAVVSDLLDRARRADPSTVELLAYQDAGFSQEAIAELMSDGEGGRLTVGAVEGRLYRGRRRLQAALGGGADDHDG